MKNIITTSILALFLVLGACSKGADKDTKTEGSGHADEEAVPGSHEDWCEEHNVPESQCTRCHPALAAAFKAVDDWCEEHGLPRSHDRKHNPDLKLERPAKK